MRRNKDKEVVYIGDRMFYVPPEVKRHIDEREQMISTLEHAKWKLEGELNAIKPIVEDKRVKPAISENCSECKYVVKSPWNDGPLMCCKDSVCEDYTPKE